jgi:hypothetical protein
MGLSSQPEYSCAHGAQINLGDLTPYLTYDLNRQVCSFRSADVYAGEATTPASGRFTRGRITSLSSTLWSSI